jgi:FkbM family methyltransferase
MNPALAALAPDAGSWDAVIWAGVGRGAELESVRALGGRHCYVEPHPGLRQRIAARLDAGGRARVEARALWSKDGTAVFHLANDAVSSTLLPPGEAWAGRPNLRVVEEVEVETVSLATLIEALGMEEHATALLILDIGGGEEDVLAATEEQVLRRFRHILVPSRCEQAAARLRHVGFIQGEIAGEWRLLGWPTAAPPDPAREIEQLSGELAARSAELQDLAGQLERAHGELDALGKGQAELTAERDSALAALAEALRERDEQAASAASLQERFVELQERLAALEGESATRVDELRGERDAADERATTLQQKLTAFSEESARTIAALTAERDTAIGSLVEKTALAERLQVDQDRWHDERARLQARVDQLEAEMLEARRTVALSVKLQAQRDADLADLQQRYSESQDVQGRQRKLLELLGERLGVASRYFHQLADEREQG